MGGRDPESTADGPSGAYDGKRISSPMTGTLAPHLIVQEVTDTDGEG